MNWREGREIGRSENTPMRGAFDPSFVKPEWLTDDYGRICLCPDGHPIEAHPGMPLTISTDIEGWHVDVIRRLNPSIKNNDFRQRMLPIIRLTRQAISMRASRARQDLGRDNDEPAHDAPTASNSRKRKPRAGGESGDLQQNDPAGV